MSIGKMPALERLSLFPLSLSGYIEFTPQSSPIGVIAMSNDEADTREVKEAPSESSPDGAVAQLARDSQEKPQDQAEREKTHEELRKARQTASSEMLLEMVIEDYGPKIVKALQQQFDSGSAADIAANDNTKKPLVGDAPNDPGDKGANGKGDAGGKTEDLGDGVKVTSDFEGKVTKIEGPGGASDLKYTNDEDGKPQLSEIDRPGGFKYQKEEDGTWTYRNDKGDQIGHYKSIEAGKDGALKITNDNGDITTLKPNGEVTNKHEGVTTNSDGNVTDVEYPNGRKAHVEYDKDGKPTQLTETRDGKTATWKKESDGWNRYDENGAKTTRLEGDVTVDKNGDITFGVTKKGDVALVKHANGSETAVGSDGSKVTQDADGKVTKIEGPGGAFDCKYTNDKDGKPVLTEIERPGGFKYHKEEDGTWSYRNDKGEQIAHYKSVDVSPDGQIKIVSDNGDISRLSPGGKVSNTRDGVTTNSDGNVTDVESPNGRKAHVEYDQNNKPTQVTETVDGKTSTWKKEADGWNRYDEGGNKTSRAEDITVDSNGDIRYNATKKGDVALVKHANGGDTEISSDGVKLTRDADGKISKVEGPGGPSECKYTNDKDGKPVLTEVGRPGGFKYQKEGDGSWTYRNDKGEEIGKYKNLELGDRGEIKLTNNDGSVDTLKPGGDVTSSKGSVEKDGWGNVTHIRDAEGKDTRIVYKDGQPSQIVEPDQSRWIKAPDGGWTHFKEGKPIGRSHDIQVREDGDIAFVNKDGTATLRHPNRTSTEVKGDGSTVERDAKGKITEVQSPEGKKSTVEYDSSDPPKPNKIVEADKSRWEKGADGTWTHRDEQGKELGKSNDVQVRPDGDIVFLDGEGGGTKRHPDRSETDISGDGSVVQRDPSGKVTEVTSGEGKQTKIQYEGNEVKQVTLPSGKTWAKEGDHYVQRGPDGKETGLTAEKIDVAKNGDVKYTSKESEITFHRDQKVTEVKDGKVVSNHFPDGTHIDYKDNEVQKVTTQSGKTWTKEGDGYVQRDAEGKETGMRMDKIEVSEKGDIKFTSKETGQEITTHRDGSTTQVEEGKVTRVDYPDGGHSQIEYEGNEVKKVTSDSGKTFTKEGDKYVQRDSQGNPTGVEVDNITVRDNGEIVLISKATGQKIIRTRDGQVQDEELQPSK